jgi:hypothetical protein
MFKCGLVFRLGLMLRLPMSFASSGVWTKFYIRFRTWARSSDKDSV